MRLATSPEAADYQVPRGLNRGQFHHLLTSQWILAHHPMVVTGHPWCDKTFGLRVRPPGLTPRPTGFLLRSAQSFFEGTLRRRSRSHVAPSLKGRGPDRTPNPGQLGKTAQRGPAPRPRGSAGRPLSAGVHHHPQPGTGQSVASFVCRYDHCRCHAQSRHLSGLPDRAPRGAYGKPWRLRRHRVQQNGDSNLVLVVIYRTTH